MSEAKGTYCIVMVVGVVVVVVMSGYGYLVGIDRGKGCVFAKLC